MTEIPFSDNEVVSQVYENLKNLIISHKSASEKYCFSRFSENHPEYIQCINERLSTISIYQQAFKIKHEYEHQNFIKCLHNEPFITPKICLKDLENNMYKNLKEFSKIFN